jgi:RIP metalloprotease RseP
VDALRSKAYWQKFLVFSAGCINNFLTAVCVFFFMDFIGHHWAQPTPPVVEIVENVDLAGSGVQAGDKVVKIGKHSVEDFNELQSRWMDATKNEPVPKFIKLDVERAGTTQTVEVPTEPPVGTQLPAGQIVQINDVKVSNEKAVTKAIANLLTLAKLDPIQVVVRTRDNQEITTTVPVLAAVGKDWPLFAWQPRQPAFVAQPLPNLPAEKAGARVGDEIVSVAGVPVSSAVRATREIRKHLGETIPIEVKRGTEKKGFETVKLDVEVRPHPDNPKLGQIGIAFGAGPPTQFIKKPFGEAFRGAFQKAGLFVLLYVDGIQDLLKSSFQTLRESVGGPIAIGTQAYKAANEGWPYFFWLFATFNIILAVTNLLPLPVFDGGHILFSTIEAIIRRPLPAKFMLFVYQTFTFLIIGLALVITFNDVVMNWWRLR